jgi:ABC-type sugar transport system ATPase subunit
VYARPSNTFVARFIGAPAMNLVSAALVSIDAPDGATAGIRPHDVVLGEGGLRARVDLVEPRGHDAVIHLRVDGPPAMTLAAVAAGPAPGVGEEVRVTLPHDRLHLFGADGRRL